jgi:DNA-binding XRE family transcriptional regulator
MTKITTNKLYHGPLSAVENALEWQAAAAEMRLSRNDVGSIGSHWDGCWRSEDHHACAVARCERLEVENHKLRVTLGFYESTFNDHAKQEDVWAENSKTGWRKAKQWLDKYKAKCVAMKRQRATIKGLCRRLRLLRRYRDIPFGANIRAMRKRWGLTLTEVARWAGMASSDLAAIERGLAIPDTQTMLRICHLFGCDIDAIMHGPRDDTRRWARVWKRFARKMWRKNRGLSQKER